MGAEMEFGETISAWQASAAGRALQENLALQEEQGKQIFPQAAQRFRALTLTPLSAVKVVILGQDPYHGLDAATGRAQAEGLAFSVPDGLRCPPSLRNIFKELERDLGLRRTRTSLVDWAEQGVLLLNTVLTVEQGRAASHANLGWEALSDALIAQVAAQSQNVVFMLWGAHAQRKLPLIEAAHPIGKQIGRHMILQANHPSPLSALRPPLPFIGCGHFSQANLFLAEKGKGAIRWN